MAWRVVVQPNAKYALYSDVVTDFTLLNMSRAEAVEACFQEIQDAEVHYREQCRRLGVEPRERGPKEWSPRHDEGVWRNQAERKVFRAEQAPERWLEELESIKNVHGRKGVEQVLAYDQDGRSHWPAWVEEEERTRRFKKDDRVIPKIRGVELTVHEVLPFKWYVLANEAGPVGRWKDHELDPAPAAVRA